MGAGCVGAAETDSIELGAIVPDRPFGGYMTETKIIPRAKRILDRVPAVGTSLPQSTMDTLERAQRSMRDAAMELNRADGDKAMVQQRGAQRMLDAASDAVRETERPLQSSREERGDMDGVSRRVERLRDGDGAAAATASIESPSADALRGPDAFRRRVVEGMHAAR